MTDTRKPAWQGAMDAQTVAPHVEMLRKTLTTAHHAQALQGSSQPAQQQSSQPTASTANKPK